MVCAALTKILKESLIYRNYEASPTQMSRPVAFKSRVSRNLNYANAVRGRLSDSQCSFYEGLEV